MDFILSNNLIISGITKREKKLIKDKQSFVNPAYIQAQQFKRSTYGIKKTIRLYKESNGNMILPRGTLCKMLNLFGPPKNFIDNTISLPKVEIPSKIKLRSLQTPWVEDLLQHTQGVGVAPAGSGKTIMMLQAASRVGQPFLWLTHRQTLLEQVIERINSFYGEVGTIGRIGGGKFELGDIVTVGMVQTLVKRDLTDLKDKFGLIILDEGHIVPALQVSKVIRQFYPKYLYSVTATPYREDLLEQLIFDTVGPIIANMDRQEVVEASGIMNAEIKVRKTNITCALFNPEYHEIINYLSTHEDRNLMVLTDVLYEVALGNVCIVLTNRVEHGKYLKESLEQLGVGSTHLHGSSTQKQRKNGFDKFKSDEVAVIIATYSFLAEGFDHPKANRIFFSLPYKAKGLITQSRGRIERTFPGKVDAILYDYVDSIPSLERQFESRLDQYEEHDLTITYH